MPLGTKAPKLLPADPSNVMSMVSVRKPLAAIGFGHLVAEHGADRAVHVGDRGREPDRRAGVERLAAHHDQLLIERLVQTVVLARTAVQVLVHERRFGLVQDRRQVQLVGLPVLGGLGGVQRVDLADRLVEGAEAQLGQQFPDLLGDEHEEVLDELRLAGEPLAQHRVLGGDTRPGRCRGGTRAS